MRPKTTLPLLIGLFLVLQVVQAQEYGVMISISPKEAKVKPCGIASFDISIINTGEKKDTFTISIEGIPEGWYSLSEDSVTLEAGESKKVYLFITPYCYAKPGSYEGKVLVSDHANDTASFTLEVVLEHIIQLEVPEKIETCLGERTAEEIVLKNTGNYTEDVQLSLGGDAAKFSELEEESIEIEAGEEKTINLFIEPKDVEIGTYNLTIEAISKTSYARDSASIPIEVKECYKVNVTAPEEIKVCKGETTTFEIEVENIGLKEDTYTLEIADLNFSESFTLSPEETEKFEIEYYGEKEGVHDIEFTVVSDYTKFEGTIKVNVEICYAVSLTLEEKEIEIEIGRGKLLVGRVKNEGTKEDTFTITSNVSWSTVKPEMITLEPGESEDIYFYFSPEYGMIGKYAAKLSVSSEKSEDVKEVTITVKKKVVPEVETTVEVETTEEVPPPENVTTEVPAIPTGKIPEVWERIAESRVLRSLIVAVIIVIVILAIIYVVAIR